MTLVELLVTLIIIGFAASVVVLNAPPPRSPARDAAESFAARLAVIADEAVLSGRPHRVEARERGYVMARREAAGWRTVYAWSPGPARGRRVAFSLSLDEAAVSNVGALNAAAPRFAPPTDGADDEEERPDGPVAQLDPVGGGVGFTAAFSDGRARWTVKADPSGEISLRRG